MSFEFKFSQQDLDRGTPVPAGWYKAKIEKIEAKPAGTDKSTNILVHFKCTYVNESDGSVREKKIFRVFNEKAPGFAVNFFAACNGGVKPSVGTGYDFAKTEGLEIEIYIKEKPYDGRIVNEVTDYRPLS